ncbi:MAG TPA: DNA-directed RNA polymerase subunit epsilon [Virgibacillus sp.]|nr:DNA-directed RNA polymerase subunit epsilon [Virgibacillus sp.]
MIFKVLYQALPNEVPVRERTKSLYMEAESVREVRQKLIDRDYNINVEFIQALDEVHLAFEKQSEDFVLENV